MREKATVFAAILSLSSLGATVALAATLIVDINDPGCSDVVGTPFCTIQPAIDAAVPFDLCSSTCPFF